MSNKQLEGEAQHQLIVQEAQRRGILTENFPNISGRTATMLRSGSLEELLVQGIPESWMSEHASRLCNDKQLTKELFSKLGIPTLDSIEFTQTDKLAVAHLFDGQKRFVCKPAIGTNGIGVSLEIRSIEDIRDYCQENIQLGPSFLLEEYHPGYDLRIQVIDSRIAAACVRLPARVLGDGNISLRQLIAERRKVIQMQNPANDLVLDNESRLLIEQQGLTLDSIVPQAVVVQLKRLSNMAQGGHAIDVTDELAPGFTQWIDAIALEICSGYFALDIMCTEHKTLSAESAKALEINIRAEWMHHTFSEVRTHDLAKTIVDVLFGEEGGHLPFMH